MVYGTVDSVNADVGALMIKFIEKFSNKSKLSTVNIPELNQKIDRIEKSMDISEISRLMAEIYQYAYDNYLMNPFAKPSLRLLPPKGFPSGIRAFAETTAIIMI